MTTIRCGILLMFCCLLGTSATTAGGEPDSLAELSRKIDILAEELDRLRAGGAAELQPLPVQGLSPGAGRVYTMQKAGVSFAGYGEALYENFATARDNGTASGLKDRIDFLRAVLYAGYRFNDWILFNSEIEFEHGSTGKGGEVSVEFGYIDLVLSPWLTVRSGLVLVPVGIVNEKHEPSTFFGTSRPLVERLILPATWRAVGTGALGEIMQALSYRLFVVEGLKADGYSGANGIRGGRQHGAQAVAENFAVTGRLEFSPSVGTTIGADIFVGNAGQGMTDSLGTIAAMTTVGSVHGELSWRGLELRGLYAFNHVSDAARISAANGGTIGSRMEGWYLSAGYDVLPHMLPTTTHALIPYAVFERYNTHAAVPAGFSANPAYDRRTLALGIMYRPDPRVAFKWDYRDNWSAAGTAANQWNVALNYLF